jgi:DNA-binding NtrC family response regulator
MARPILIADVPELEEFLRGCFPGRPVLFVSHFQDATAALAGRDFGLILIGMHFDDSQMFALLRHVRKLRRHAQTPVVCVRALPSILSRSAQESIEHAARILGATAFLDMAPGADAAAELRCLLESHIRAAPDPGTAPRALPLSKPFDIA